MEQVEAANEIAGAYIDTFGSANRAAEEFSVALIKANKVIENYTEVIKSSIDQTRLSRDQVRGLTRNLDALNRRIQNQGKILQNIGFKSKSISIELKDTEGLWRNLNETIEHGWVKIKQNLTTTGLILSTFLKKTKGLNTDISVSAKSANRLNTGIKSSNQQLKRLQTTYKNFAAIASVGNKISLWSKKTKSWSTSTRKATENLTRFNNQTLQANGNVRGLGSAVKILSGDLHELNESAKIITEKDIASNLKEKQEAFREFRDIIKDTKDETGDAESNVHDLNDELEIISTRLDTVNQELPGISLSMNDFGESFRGVRQLNIPTFFRDAAVNMAPFVVQIDALRKLSKAANSTMASLVQNSRELNTIAPPVKDGTPTVERNYGAYINFQVNVVATDNRFDDVVNEMMMALNEEGVTDVDS